MSQHMGPDPTSRDPTLGFQESILGLAKDLGGTARVIPRQGSKIDGEINPLDTTAFEISHGHTRLILEIDNQDRLISVNLSTQGETGPLISRIYHSNTDNVITLADAHAFTTNTIRLLFGNIDSAVNSIQSIVGPENLKVQFPFNASPIRELYGKLISVFWENALVHPTEKKDDRFDAYTRTRYSTSTGLNKVLEKLGDNPALIFSDKDNMGVLNDFGLKEVGDYLLKYEAEMFKRYFDIKKDEMGSWGGDEIVYFTNATPEKLNTFREMLTEINKRRDQIFRAENLPGELKGISDIQGKVSQAHKAAEFKKINIALRTAWRSQAKGDISSEAMGEWLLSRIAPQIRDEWLNKCFGIKNEENASLKDIAALTSQPAEFLAHNLKTFIAARIHNGLSPGNIEFLKGIAIELLTPAEKAKDSTRLMGTSYSAVKLSENLNPYGLLSAVATGEKGIYDRKLGVPVVDGFSPMVSSMIPRKSERFEIQELTHQVMAYDNLMRIYNEQTLSSYEKDSIMAQVFSIMCLDPGSKDVLRLQRISDYPCRPILGMETSAYYSYFGFHIKAGGAFNKGEGMPYLNKVFSDCLERLETSMPDDSPKPQIKLREGGATGGMYLEGSYKLSQDQKDSIQAILTQIVQDKITPYIEIDFYEKQSMRLWLTQDSFYTDYRDKLQQPEELGKVEIISRRGKIDGNQKFMQAHAAIMEWQL